MMRFVNERNAMEVCVFGLLAGNSAGAALGLTDLPNSMRLNPDFGRFAVTVLFLGSLLALAGMFWRVLDTGLILEQFGVALVGFGCLFYLGALALNNAYATAALAMGMSAGIAVACAARYWQIQSYIRRRKALFARAERDES